MCQEAPLLGGQSAGFHRWPRDSDRVTAGLCSAVSLPAPPSERPAGQEPGASVRLRVGRPRAAPSGLVSSSCVFPVTSLLCLNCPFECQEAFNKTLLLAF